MPGLHDHIICSAPSLHRVVVPRRAQWTLCFHFGSTHQPPFLAPVTAIVFPPLSLSLSLSVFLFRFSRVFLISFVSPLSPKPTTLLSFLFAFSASVTSIFLHSRVDGFGRVKEPPLPRPLFCFALRAVEPFAIVTATSSIEGCVSRVSYGSLLE